MIIYINGIFFFVFFFALGSLALEHHRELFDGSFWKEIDLFKNFIIKKSNFKNKIFQAVCGNKQEQPGSIVNETRKNRILILKDTSKELDFHADFKCISFIKFSHTHRKLRAWENLLYFRK